MKVKIACENIRFSSLFAAGDVPRETFPSTKSEEKRIFSQANVKTVNGILKNKSIQFFVVCTFIDHRNLSFEHFDVICMVDKSTDHKKLLWKTEKLEI